MPAYGFGYTTPNKNFTRALPVIKLKYNMEDEIGLVDLMKDTEVAVEDILKRKENAVDAVLQYTLETEYLAETILELELDEDNMVQAVTIVDTAEYYDISRFNNTEKLLLQKVIYRVLHDGLNGSIDAGEERFAHRVRHFLNDDLEEFNLSLMLLNIETWGESFDDSVVLDIDLYSVAFNDTHEIAECIDLYIAGKYNEAYGRFDAYKSEHTDKVSRYKTLYEVLEVIAHELERLFLLIDEAGLYAEYDRVAMADFVEAITTLPSTEDTSWVDEE